MLRVLTIAALTLVTAFGARADAWDDTLAKARGQTVYWNAWGGDEQINAYIAWVGEQVAERYGVELVHVKLTDTAEAVGRVVAEKASGRNGDGSVDLIWINGENFAAMKRQDLLFGPFAESLPNFRLVDTAGKPTTLVDFTMPTEGFEAPWGMAQFVFLYDTRERAGAAALDRGAARLGQGQSGPLHLSGAAGLHRHHLPQAGPDRADARPGRACSGRSRRPTSRR